MSRKIVLAALVAAAALGACGGPKNAPSATNAPPQFSPAPPANFTAAQNSPAAVPFNVVDPNDDPVTVTATGLPPGLVVRERVDVTTVAGTGVPGFANGPAASAQFNFPYGIAVDPARNIYVGDSQNNRVRKIDTSGVVSTAAGISTAGFWDGPGYASQLNRPEGLAVDAAGNIYVADGGNHRIRKIDAKGVISNFAGTGVKGNKGGPRLQAQVQNPSDVAVDKAGNLYVVATLNFKIWKISPDGDMTVFAGTGGGPGPVGYKTGSQLPKPKIGPATSVALDMPEGVAIGSNGDVYVTETQTIRRIDAAGMVTTVAGEIEGGHQDGPGEFARFNFLHGIDVDSKGNIFVGDTWNDVIRKIDPAGFVSTFAGDGAAGFADGPAATARFSKPRHIVIDADGSILVADERNHRIRRITPNGYEIAGRYSGDPCGGQFPAVIRATDSKGAFTETKIVFDVPKSEECEEEQERSPIVSTGSNGSTSGDPVSGGPTPPPATYDVSTRKSLQTFQYAQGLATIFSVIVRNEGPSPIEAASGLVVTDTLPANFAPPATIKGGPKNLEWDCSISGLAVSCVYVGGPRTVGEDLPTIVIESFGKTPGKYENCATASLQAVADSNLANNRGCASSEITAPPSNLGIAKKKVSLGECHGQVGNPNPNHCEFVVSIRNDGPSAYAGPVSFKDTVNGPWLPIQNGAVNVSPAGWSCTPPSSPPTPSSITCSNPTVSLAPGAKVDVTLVMNIFTPGAATENCAVLTVPAQAPPPTACVSFDSAPAPATGLFEIRKVVVDLTGGTPLALYKFPIYLSCSNNPGVWVAVPLAANSSTLSPPSPAGVICSAAENWGAAGPQVPSVKCPSGKAIWTPSYFPDSGQGAATVQIPAGGTATIVITNTLKCDDAAPPPTAAQLVVEKLVEELGKGISWKKPLPTGPNAAFTIEVTCPSLNGGKPAPLKLEHQKSQTISVPVGETCTVVEPSQATPSALPCGWQPAETSYLDVAANKTTTSGASVTLGAAKTYTVRVTNKAHCPGLF